MRKMSSKKSSDSSKREVSVSAMSFLRGSTNYVWCTTSVLGKGATGAVFQGVNRHTGEQVAVKTFNQLSHMRPQEVQMREFEVLQKVNHENIVKLLAIEEEQEGRGKVIVMELCTGGSLFNILDDPENSHGLEESEFLRVLKHLAAGMKHLRDNNLVHRDLKPGNVMKYIDIDGYSVYKLTDFGAARELDDDQQFLSLYGTEEYLHPDLYERAVLRKPVGKSFGARVDLWSIGVTLYHVATGQLPFRPFGGRRNKETMYLITTEKAPGVISGVQTSENGPIEWCTELPAACQLSLGLRNLVTPLLAGLLEVDPQKMWNFETFFTEVTKILQKKRIHLFYVNRVQSLIIYMNENHRFEQFQSLICDQTEVLPCHQLLILDSKPLETIIDSQIMGKSYPETTMTSAIVMFSKQEDDVVIHFPEVHPLKFASFPNMVSVEHDAAVGKSICAIGDAIRRRVEFCYRCILNIETSVSFFVEVLKDRLKSLHTELEHLKDLTKAASDRFSQLVANHRRFLVLLQMLGSTDDAISGGLREKLEDLINNKVEEEKAVRESLDSLVPVVSQLYSRIVIDGQLKSQFKLDVGSSSKVINRAPNKANTFVAKLRESWQHLLRDRAARTLTLNDEQFHLLEKMKMKEVTKSFDNLLSNSTSCASHASEHLADWCKIAKVQRVQTEIEEADVRRHKNLLEAFQTTLTQTEDDYHYTLSEILGSVKDQRIQDLSDTMLPSGSFSENGKNATKKEKKLMNDNMTEEKYKHTLKQLSKAQDTVLKLLEENGSIIKQFQEIAGRQPRKGGN